MKSKAFWAQWVMSLCYSYKSLVNSIFRQVICSTNVAQNTCGSKVYPQGITGCLAVVITVKNKRHFPF